MTIETTAPLTVFAFGESSLRHVDGIDFSRSVHVPDFSKPTQQKKMHRIGNTKVPEWLYELVLGMAQEREEARRPHSVAIRSMGFMRHADGQITAVLETKGDLPDDQIADAFRIALGGNPT